MTEEKPNSSAVQPPELFSPVQVPVQQAFLPRAVPPVDQSGSIEGSGGTDGLGSRRTNPVGRTAVPGAGPLSPPKVRSVVKRLGAIAEELAAVRSAWGECQASRDRDAIYPYLTAVFGLMARWHQENRWQKSLDAALDLLTTPLQMKIGEAYALIIYCTADRGKVDAKTRSKWCRVLRYAAEFKPDQEPLKTFIKRRGGLNACAQQFTRKLGRRG